MKNKLASLALALACAFLLQPISSIFAQGPLAPPGAPAPTMKSLQQIEPRTDILKLTGDADYHHIITQAGSYYLSDNLAVTKPNGIYVRFAEGVTIDLNGFEIRRTSGSAGDGIAISAVSHRCTVKNGSIKGFAIGIRSLFSVSGPAGGSFLELTVADCSNYGLVAGEGSQIDGCKAHANSGNAGIYTSAGCILTNCTATNNATNFGIFAGNGSTLTNCSAYGNTGTAGLHAAEGCTLSHCAAYGNASGFGISVESSCSLTNCAASDNSSSGSFSAGILASGGCTLTACSSSRTLNSNATRDGSTGMGFSAGSGTMIKNCTAFANTGDGIQVGSVCLVSNNHCNNNGTGFTGGDGAGIHATGSENRIDGNNVSNNDRGIDVDDVRNFIIRNTARDNAGMNYVIVTGNRVGIIVVPALSGDIAGDIDPDAVGVGTTDPWANFTY